MIVGIVGLGGMGRHHARVVRGFDFVQDVMGCDTAEACRTAARDEGITTSFATLHELLAARPDAVIVATQPAAHAACSRPFLEAGVPVLTEKPLTTDVNEGRELVALAEERGVALQVGFELRCCGLTRGMQAILAEGMIGEPVRMSLLQNAGAHPKRDWWTRMRCQGVFYEKLCHQIDLYRMWLGEPERIMAVCSPNVIDHYEIADHAYACMVFPGGRLGTMAFNTSRAAQAGGSDDHGDRGHFYELTLTCTRGSITYDAWTERLELIRYNHREDLKTELAESIPVRERYGEPAYDLGTQNREFLERVQEGKPPRFPARDALISMEWVAKAERSLAAGGAWMS